MKYFCFSDIHGCYDQFIKLLKKTNYKEEDFLVFLGDYIDRGPDSRKVLDFLIDLKVKHKNCVFLMGNHEEMFLNFIEKPYKNNDIFLYNGGHQTLKNFKSINDEGIQIWDIDQKYIDFIKEMKLWYETDDYFFVHAGVPDKDLNKITYNDKEELLWVRDSFLESEFFWEKMIIHGHTPTDDFNVDFNENRINIDTGHVFGGKLTCLILPENTILQIDTNGI